MKRAPRLLRQYTPQPPKHTTPVLSSTRWDGAPYRLVPPRTTLPPLILKDNVYARILASPSRTDRTLRLISLPRSLLVKYSLLRHPQTKEQWLVPNVDVDVHTGTGSGYGPNSQEQVKKLKGKRYATVSGLELLSATYNLTTVKDVKWNEDNWYVIQALYLQELLKEVEELQVGNAIEDNSLVVCLQGGSEPIHVQGSITYINLSNLEVQHPSYQKLLHALSQMSRDAQVIVLKENYKLIDTFVKFVSYFHA